MNMLCSRSICSLPGSPFTALFSLVDVRCLSKSQFLTQGQHAAGSSFQSAEPRVLLAWFSPANRGRQRGERRANPQINDCYNSKESLHMTCISSNESYKHQNVLQFLWGVCHLEGWKKIILYVSSADYQSGQAFQIKPKAFWLSIASVYCYFFF